MLRFLRKVVPKEVIGTKNSLVFYLKVVPIVVIGTNNTFVSMKSGINNSDWTKNAWIFTKVGSNRGYWNQKSIGFFEKWYK